MNYLKASILLLIAFVAQALAQWQRCAGRPWIAACHQGPNWGMRGRGCSPRVMWWYDRNMRYCRQMWYAGCGGNSNRWCNRQECEQRCRR